MSQNLCESLLKNVEFYWLDTHEQAFLALKNLITQSETLRYYDVLKAFIMSSESYVTDRKLKAIQVEIKTNETMQLLVQQIQSGWPENNFLHPMSLCPYYAYR